MMTLETAQRLTDQMKTLADTTTMKFVLDHSNLDQEAFERKAREFFPLLVVDLHCRVDAEGRE
jgi:hypothetical protein